MTTSKDFHEWIETDEGKETLRQFLSAAEHCLYRAYHYARLDGLQEGGEIARDAINNSSSSQSTG